jgi:cytochrome c553
MKKNIFATYISILIGVIFITVGVLSAADVTTAVKTTTAGGATITNVLTIENKGYKEDKKGSVTFSHLKHSKDYKAACTDCHHVYDANVKNTWKEGNEVKTCVSCHDPEKDQGNAKKLQTAYHNNCKECHKKSGKDTAPSSKCNDCHAKS